MVSSTSHNPVGLSTACYADSFTILSPILYEASLASHRCDEVSNHSSDRNRTVVFCVIAKFVCWLSYFGLRLGDLTDWHLHFVFPFTGAPTNGRVWGSLFGLHSHKERGTQLVLGIPGTGKRIFEPHGEKSPKKYACSRLSVIIFLKICLY
jgi:hypothetical protein